MPRVVIAGCGYVGAATADLFHAHGWTVEGWTASEESAGQLSAKPYPVRAVDFVEALPAPGEPADAVIHCASTKGGDAAAYRAVYLEGARHLAAAFPRALLLFTGSTSVYAQRDGDWVDESSPAEPAHASGRVLRETEDFVRAHGGIVARLAGIYGPGRSALLRKFLAGTATIETEDRYVNQAHRDDIAAALFALIRSGQRGEVYNVADGHPLLLREAYNWLANHLGGPLPPVASPPAERKRGRSNKRVRSEKLQALGWQPQFSDFAAAMTASILPKLAELGA